MYENLDCTFSGQNDLMSEQKYIDRNFREEEEKMKKEY